MNEYFKEIPQIKYEGAGSANPLAFKHYNPEQVVLGKKMKDQLRFAASYWHTFSSGISDMFGAGSRDVTYGKTSDMDIAYAKADAAFEFMSKLGIDLFCFHDADLISLGESLEESNRNVEAITDYIADLMAGTDIKLLWGTSNLFGHPRYMHGAATSPNADVFAYAAGQVKTAIDATIRLGGEGYTFWGGREGYETLLNTDMALEQDNLARFLRMAVDYARSRGFDGYFYIEPKPKEPTKHQYDFDTATCLAFLRKYGLDKDLKMNLEANHATLAQHTFQHEIRVAADNGVFGSIDANMGDMLLGWDTDQFPTNAYDTTLAMLEILRAGGFTKGGLNFDAKVRRGSFTKEDLFYGYIAGMDTFAIGLKAANAIIEDGRLDDFVRSRYASYGEGIGKDIVSGKATIESLSEYALNMGEVKTNISGRQEYLEGVLNDIMFRGL